MHTIMQMRRLRASFLPYVPEKFPPAEALTVMNVVKLGTSLVITTVVPANCVL